MERQRFEEWLRSELSGNFFLCERRVSQVYFREICVPEIQEKCKASGISWVHGESEWEKKRQELVSPSLFPRREVIFLEGFKEEGVLKIAQEAPRYLEVLFFLLLSPAETLKEPFWRKFPRIIVEESREVFLHFLREEEARLDLVLEDDARESLFRLASEYELQRGDIVDFLERCRGGRVTKDEVEAFFTQSEKALLFRFLDALGERNAASALRYVYRLLDQQFPPSLLVTHLARRFRLFAQFCESGETRRDLWQGKEINPLEARKIEKMKKHFTSSDVPRIFAVLRTADRILKTQSVDPRLWCVLLVSGITQLGKESG
ncbi:MAG: hypothetical protein ABDK87_05330 [Atribacterota bacterium]